MEKYNIQETSITSSFTSIKDVTLAPDQNLHSRVQQLTLELQTAQNQLHLTVQSESEAREKVQR